MALDFTRSSEQFLASLDSEIERLQQVRQQIAAALGAETQAKSAGVPKRGMSAEGRRKIAEAQKARWAKQKSAAPVAAKRPADKQTPAKNASAKTAKKAVTSKLAAKKTPST